MNKHTSGCPICGCDKYQEENISREVWWGEQLKVRECPECMVFYLPITLEKPIMSPEAGLKRMREIFTVHDVFKFDKEDAHILADDLMCAILTQNGYREMVEVFREADKWYA